MVQKILTSCRNLHELENFHKNRRQSEPSITLQECLIDGKYSSYSALVLTCSNFYDLYAIKFSIVSSYYEIQGF
uniref:Uncharacterized protein n=1 Tax=Glossina palpalis gambiensis TaxID=67801 RepID=A0A1B0B0U0_9MUSC